MIHAVLRHYHDDEWDELFSNKLKANLGKRLELAERALEHEFLPGSQEGRVKAEV